MADYCDKIKAGDERFEAARTLVRRDGCARATEALEACLARNARMFARCQSEARELRSCFAHRPATSRAAAEAAAEEE